MRHLTRMSRNLSRWGSGFTYLYLSLMLLCFCAIGVKAADTNGSVKFNSGVRYSQWAINSRLHDFYGNQKAYGFAKWNSGTESLEEYANKTNMKLDYVAGLVGKATLETSDYYVDFDWAKPWFKSAQAYATDYNYSAQDPAKMTLDNMNAAKMAFHIINNKKWGEDKAKTTAKNAIEAIITDLRYYNENYVIGGTKSNVKEATANDVQKKMLGGWFHKYNYVDQVWCDGMYMGPALLAQLINYKNATNNVSNDDWSLLTKQFSITWEQLRDSKTGLLYHGMTATPTITDWSKDATPTSYHSGAFWGRANAWYMLALVDVLELMPTSNTNYSTLKDYLEKLAASIASYQNEDGTWYQVLDQKDNALNGNYEESSCSALFTAAYLKALRLKLLESSKYETMAKNAYVALVNKFMAYDKDDNNKIQILGSCCSAGLGTNNNILRDGSRSYYINGNDSKAVTGENTGYYYTEGKVLGGFIMAATEYERAYQNQDSKQILFAKDLAPSYDFSTTAGTLDATAYGNGTVSYQWYKDGSAIADATSATYTPKESGNYYCIATSATNSRSAGGNTIQTSTTTVTTANTDNGSTDNNNGGSENGTTTGNIFSYTIKTTEKDANTPYDAEGGTVTLGAAKDDTKNGYKLDGEFDKSVYIKITLSGTKLQEGDIIKISANSASTGKGGLVAYTGTTAGSSSVSLGSMTQKSEDISYTVKASDILNGLNTFYIYRKTNESTYVKSISITRANTQVALTASFFPATISATEGDVAQNLPALTVKAGETTLTANDYTVTYASDNNAVAKVENGKVSFVGEGETKIVATIKPTDTNKYNETSATFAVKVEKKQTPVTQDDVIYNWNTIGSQKENIAVTEGTKNINGTFVPCINFGSNYDVRRYTYMSIKDKYNGGFKVGDIITITGLYTGPKTTGIGMEIHTTRDGKAVFSTPYYDKELKTYTYTLTEDCDSLFFGRYGGATPNVTVLKVVRPAASAKQRLSANFDTNNIKVVTGTTSITLPNLTVKAGSTELTATSDYSVSYESDANEIATLNGTQVNFVSGKTGLVTITAKVTPKDATKYEGTEAYYQILIQDPTPLNISVTDIDMNTTDAEIKEPVVKVYGENDQLLKLGTDYTLSYSASNGGPVSFPDGKLTVAGSKYNWTVGVSSITVTATPTESLSKKYKEGSVDFTYTVTKGLITPKFLDDFNGITVKVATKTGKKDNFNTFTVPLIFNGEDVSSYFNYTYDITSTSPENQQNVNGNVLTYYPKNAGTYTVKVSATVKKNEKDPTSDYTDVYAAPSSITFTLDVKANYIRPVVKLNPVSVNMYTGTREDAPDVTITNYKDNSVIDESNYKVSWTTFTPGICKVDANGNIEAVSEGDGKIRVVVRGDNMESTTAFLNVLVDDPAMYRVRGTGNYGNQTRMWNQDKTLSVVLGGWLFPNPVATNGPESSPQQGPSAEGLSAASHWGTDKNLSSLPKWKLTGFDYYVVGDKNKNARQENGSNALPETTNIYSADFKSYTGIIKDKMFNVPCSGSFLEFNPATNGKVTVHIFQNGAFDSGVYRPQRRVFVMDEAGNFVESEAHIETTSGKPTGGIQPISSYKWDLNPKGKDTAPTIEEVRSHFNGIPNTFDMTANAFKNDVYESLLSTEIVPNAAAGKGNGSMGWSVLADSPVTYTFNVKAGKTYYLYNFGSKIGFYGFSFDETKPTVDHVNYDAETANANNTVAKTADGHVAQVKIARKMVANRWTTCVLPFSLNRQQVDAIFGPAYSAEAKNGTQILYFDHIEGSKAYFVRHAYNTIVAGKPFLIKPTKNIESINTADVTDYKYVTIENTEPNDWCESNGYVWTSSYNKMNIVKNDYFIGASDGKFKAYSAASGTVKGFRGFLKANLPAGAKPKMLSISTSSITDGNDGETTGIEDLIITTDGELMPANSRVYNINGQLVSEDASSFQSLPSGIYIINGKKYIK
uniref:glycoside hydrolase family 88 protein n=1 Tax=Segatella hominis TaxID=2518605 RepID=UPI0040386E07